MRRANASVELPVRIRRVTGAGGVRRIDKLVPCPTRGSTPLEVCEACDHLTAIAVDDDGLERRVDCRPAAAPPARLLPPSARDRLAAAAVAARTPVAAVMRADVTCVSCDVPIREVAALLVRERIGAVAVLDYEGFAIGMLTETELARDRWREHEECVTAPIQLERETAGALMRPIVCALAEQEPLPSAAEKMSRLGVHQLPVVDAAGALIGVLECLDLARWISGA